MAQTGYFVARHLTIVAFVALVASVSAQLSSANRSSAQTSALAHDPGRQPASSPASPTPATSLLDHPAQPARINLTSGRLTVLANNSSLSDILHQISDAAGMKVEGLHSAGNADQRIFGSYGPGTPREVLSDLLDGSGYNVLMLGVTPSGAPRELSLTSRAAGGVPNTQPQRPENSEDDSSGNDAAPQYTEPEVAPAQPPAESPNNVRTPQQMLEEMQRLRQQQLEQQQQQPQE
jgi:hypothetical protein